MHEMGLAQSIVEIVESAARDNNANRVDSVKLSIGELANIEMESLMQSLKCASANTVMQQADIAIERPSGQAWCMQCGQSVVIHRIGEACPICSGHQLTITSGTEMQVAQIELLTD